jgi:hypothetical protein
MMENLIRILVIGIIAVIGYLAIKKGLEKFNAPSNGVGGGPIDLTPPKDPNLPEPIDTIKEQ